MRLKISLRQAVTFVVTLLIFQAVIAVVAKATVTISTPNIAVVAYNLTPGESSASFQPVGDDPVILVGTDTSQGARSVGTVTLIHIPGVIIRWTGLEPTPGSTITNGGSTTPGTHVVYLDYNKKVDVQIVDADHLNIHNANTTAQAGTVKLIW